MADLPYRAWRHAMLAIADTIYAAEHAPAPGTVARLHQVIDTMRHARAQADDVAQAERIALAAHRVQEALRREGRASDTAAAIRRDLRRDIMAYMSDMPLAAFA